MNIVDELNNEFSKQKSLYKVGQQPVAELEKYKQIAMGYAEMENAVSVLSDMHTNVSYVYDGRFSQVFDSANTSLMSFSSVSPLATQMA